MRCSHFWCPVSVLVIQFGIWHTSSCFPLSWYRKSSELSHQYIVQSATVTIQPFSCVPSQTIVSPFVNHPPPALRMCVVTGVVLKVFLIDIHALTRSYERITRCSYDYIICDVPTAYFSSARCKRVCACVMYMHTTYTHVCTCYAHTLKWYGPTTCCLGPNVTSPVVSCFLCWCLHASILLPRPNGMWSPRLCLIWVTVDLTF